MMVVESIVLDVSQFEKHVIHIILKDIKVFSATPFPARKHLNLCFCLFKLIVFFSNTITA